MNPRGLSIFSFRRNFVGRNESDWVERLFGPKAIFNISEDEGGPKLPELREMFRNAFHLKFPVKKPACSMELLGFVRIDKEEPFTLSSRLKQILFVGEAEVVMNDSFEKWTCMYRSMTENWRNSYSYWPIFFYCPALSDAICSNSTMTNPENYVDGVLTLTANSSVWKANFSALPTTVSNVIKNAKTTMPGVCLAIPYSSSDSRKKLVSGAMIFEWIRYYSLFGFKVFVYDSNGANRKAIFNSAYGLSQNQQGKGWLSNVVYHPFTVMGLLKKHKETAVAEFNPELPVGAAANEDYYNALEGFDSDKVATLTHCRFEMSSLGGYDNVLVADYDEFLYCPSAATNFRSQRHFTQSLITKYRDRGIGAIIFVQLWTSYKVFGGKYNFPLDCLYEKVINQTSLFECYAGIDYNLGFSYVGKSIHLGHNCPLTDFHSSCQCSDCDCTSTYPDPHVTHIEMPYDERCYFIHLTTNPTDYTYKNITHSARAKFENISSELSQIISSRNVKKSFSPLWDKSSIT